MILNFHKIGNGSKILLAFHGIGQDFSCFMSFANTFSDRYTTYLFDLPFHGSHLDQPSFVVTKQMWKEALSQFLEKEGIDEFEIIGFSIGGRFALATFELFSTKIKKVILLAPDGIKINPMYRMATGSKVGRWLFQKVISHQPSFMKMGQTLQKMGVVSKSTVRMADFMLGTPLKQRQIYVAWVGFKELKFNLSVLAQLANHSGTPFLFFVGKYDQLLPPQQILPLSQKIRNQQTILLDTGHTKLVEKVITYLTKEGFSLI